MIIQSAVAHEVRTKLAPLGIEVGTGRKLAGRKTTERVVFRFKGADRDQVEDALADMQEDQRLVHYTDYDHTAVQVTVFSKDATCCVA